MAKLPDFGKMIGPLPLGAWIVIVGGGVGFMLYSRSSANSAVEDAAATDDGSMEYEDTSGTPGVGVGGSGQWVDVTPPTSSTDDGPEDYADNEAWGRAAINYLIAQGYNPAVSDSAIRKYLTGDAKYSNQEYALVQFALRHQGAPPTTLPAPTIPAPGIPKPPKPPVKTPPKRPTPVKRPPVKRPPVKRPPVKHPAHRYYTVKPGDNLSRIANKFYKNPKEYTRIFNANRKGKRRADGKPGMISNPNVIRPGWHLLIP